MKTVLITGANRGIGLTLCQHYLREHYQVHACCRHPDQAPELNALKSKYPQQLLVRSLDVASQESIDDLKSELDQSPLDILINNAGIYQFDLMKDHLDMKIWDRFFHTNSIGPYLLSQALLENIQRGEQKKVLNMSSSLGSITLDDDGVNIPYRTETPYLQIAATVKTQPNLIREVQFPFELLMYDIYLDDSFQYCHCQFHLNRYEITACQLHCDSYGANPIFVTTPRLLKSSDNLE